MKKILINKTINDIFINDMGITVSTGSSYEIATNDFQLWYGSSDVVTQILNGNIIVSDGENELRERIAISLIQDNQIVLNEFYTLVQDDDILIGNGKILYLFDRAYTTNNVPRQITRHYQDDAPING